ncbi:MAG: hypothetical protein JSR17_01110 [Proteobacteria bacterium]|nr:hypothetical protein [Pseudomonadota bacterium]
MAEMLIWLTENIGLKNEELRIREHTKDELSHYSSATFDIEFRYPFGSKTDDSSNITNQYEYKELCGIANRGNYDISQHAKFSKQNLLFFDTSTKEKLIPHVIEPSIGLERLFLAVLCSSYEFDKERDYVVLHLKNKLCPVECAVLPLVNKFCVKAREIFERLVDGNWRVSYDKGGSIGRRYARQDELGTKWCITIDGETELDNTVTIRDRDSKEQKRVAIQQLLECSSLESL